MAGDFADIPYVQARSFGAARETTQVVVIHATDNTATAAGEASYAARRTDQVSTHFFVDEQQCIQSVPLSAVAFGCLWHGNHRSVQFELCGRSNQITDATMRRAAPYVRRICDRYAIPLRKVSAADVRAGVKGICGHGDITAAFPEDHGDHTDPGSAFPWATFIGYVVAGTGEQGDDMALDPLEHAQINNAERYLQSIFGLTDKAIGISDTQTSRDMPSPFVAAFKQLTADVAAMRAAQSAPPTVDLDALAAKLAALLAPALGPLVKSAAGDALDGATIRRAP